MKSDIEIARSIKMKPIREIADKLKIKDKDLILYGDYKAKLDVKPKSKQGKLILVTAINPTKAGIGKTTVSIGLADAFALKNKKVCLALREPSLGPVFGIKGGATGGGYSQVVPMEDINLHFNGDFHAITSANNLLCSLIDNHIFQGNELKIDPKTVMFNRCLDINDRALRDVIVGEGRKEKFNITAASEVMAIMCLAENLTDLKERLGNIMVALNDKGRPVYAKDLHAENAMAILLKDALKPNLVQTLAGTPAIVHLGPFANIAHGCNSIIATKTAMSLSDYTITEAGFGSDLGAEKFLDVKCRIAGLKPNCVVMVATIRALKLHGGASEKDLSKENLTALSKGVPNLIKHIENMTKVYKLPTVVTLNKYATDTKAEIELVKGMVSPYANLIINDVWGQGGKGAIELADEVLKACNEPNDTFTYSYELDRPVKDKIKAIVTKIYGGKDVKYSDKALEKLEIIKKLHLSNLPVIIAKTQFSLSDDKSKLGAPQGFDVTVNDIEIRSGAKFLVAVCGSMLLMPGLSKTPAAVNMTIDDKGKVEGLY